MQLHPVRMLLLVVWVPVLVVLLVVLLVEVVPVVVWGGVVVVVLLPFSERWFEDSECFVLIQDIGFANLPPYSRAKGTPCATA